MSRELRQLDWAMEHQSQQEYAQRIIELIESWLDDTSGYDEWAWPIIMQDNEASRLSYRPRFGAKHAID